MTKRTYQLLLHLSTVLALLIAALPLPSVAQAYKCKQPNGSTSFQDQPCPTGSTGSTVALQSAPPAHAKAPQPAANAKGGFIPVIPKQGASPAPEMTRAEREANEESERVRAQNQAQRCAAAREQVAILKGGGIVYRKGERGNTEFLNSDARKTEARSAEERVVAECK